MSHLIFLGLSFPIFKRGIKVLHRTTGRKFLINDQKVLLFKGKMLFKYSNVQKKAGGF